MHVSERNMRIGEVAKATGVTVRALHHYDEIGLLVPSERSASGYRLYSDADVARLYRIRALSAMGFTLAEIGDELLRDGEDPRPAIRRHIERIDEQLRLSEQLRTQLTDILATLDRAGEPTGRMFIDAIEVMTRMERYYTPEQLEELSRRADALGEEGMVKAQDDWTRLIAEVEAHREAGTDPADPRLTPLVERWHALVEQFTGGDRGIRASLQRMYDTEGPEKASRGAVNAATMEYAQRAMRARQ
jgi:MerR family transcriptional regulator, thiopeptide resistance regulator